MEALGRRPGSYPSSRRRRLRPVRILDATASRGAHQHAEARAFWATIGPSVEAAVAFGFERDQLPAVLAKALDNGGDVLDALANELADAIEANR